MYTLEIKKKAQKEIISLPKKDRDRVLVVLELLKQNPFSGKKLDGQYEGAMSIRVWPYRIIYTIYRDIVTVTVLRVAHRKDVYR